MIIVVLPVSLVEGAVGVENFTSTFSFVDIIDLTFIDFAVFEFYLDKMEVVIIRWRFSWAIVKIRESCKLSLQFLQVLLIG